ncbi:DUF6520 family protein [Chitinophaga filiformis]|uniref:DUF6520 family protein n=1 Tax=Chitinophaga filiformis TaxID=104663 RepID=UPI001F46FB08|nr:DUF6520 family protein [Chitinophaga filiformis]MCF6401238.1 DUF6520 family protein [Chitinophaga filiformis]
MKRAKIILSVIALFAVVGGAFAFKFNTRNVWKYTFTVTLPQGVYSSTQSFCTSTNPTRFFTDEGILTIASTSTVKPGAPSTITLTDGLGHTLTIPLTSCSTIQTFTTTVN